MPSFRLPFSIWKIPVSKVSRTQPPCWLGFVWLRLRREKWKRCVRTHGCWVKLLLQSWMWSSPAAPRAPSQVSSWRSLCLLGGHLLTQSGNSLSARVVHVNSCNWLKGSGSDTGGDPARHSTEQGVTRWVWQTLHLYSSLKSQIGHYQTNIQYTPNKIHHPDIKIQTQRRRYCWSTLQSCATGVQLFPERVLTFHILCRHDFWHSNGTYSSISVKLKITRK